MDIFEKYVQKNENEEQDMGSEKRINDNATKCADGGGIVILLSFLQKRQHKCTACTVKAISEQSIAKCEKYYQPVLA